MTSVHASRRRNAKAGGGGVGGASKMKKASIIDAMEDFEEGRKKEKNFLFDLDFHI